MSRLKQEFYRVFPIFLFFLITFNLINITEIGLFKKAGLTPFTFLNIAVAAGIVAKTILVVDHMPWLNLFSKKALIYTIIWKTIIYWIVTLIIRLLIRFYPYLHISSFTVDYNAFIQNVDWRLFISIQIWYLMLFFLYVAARELTYALGPKKMYNLLFKPLYYTICKK